MRFKFVAPLAALARSESSGESWAAFRPLASF